MRASMRRTWVKREGGCERTSPDRSRWCAPDPSYPSTKRSVRMLTDCDFADREPGPPTAFPSAAKAEDVRHSALGSHAN